MPHPFFDVKAYPWHRPEAAALHRTLYLAITTPQAIDFRYKTCAGNLPPLSLGNPADVIWKEALERLTTAGVLKKLCESLLADASVRNLHDEVRAITEAEDVIEQSYLGEEIIFLDRARFRTELGKLQSNSGRRVLLVRGESGSGKSWSRRMVEQLAPENCIYLCADIVSNVKDVLENLFAPLGATVPKREAANTTDEAWFKQVCVELQKAALNKNQLWWIVMDDLGTGPEGPRLDPEIRSFFDQFALFMQNPVFAKWFRLVLIHYPEGPVPTKWKKDLWTEDQTRCADIQQPHVSEFLKKWARGKKILLADEQAESLATRVIDKAEETVAGGGAGGGTPSPRIQLIHDELLKVLEDLERSHA